jgi:hypothetical protein
MPWRLSEFEDALAAQCTSGVKGEYIVTRDISAYENSPVPAIKPAAFVEQFK